MCVGLLNVIENGQMIFDYQDGSRHPSWIFIFF